MCPEIGIGICLRPVIQQRLEQKLEFKCELRQCLQLEAAMNAKNKLPEEPPKHLAFLVAELKAKFGYDYYSSDKKYLEQIAEIKDRGRLINFLMYNKSIYSFGGISDKAIKKVSKLLSSECLEDIVYDYANLIVTQDLLGNVDSVRVPSQNFERNFEKLRLKTLKDVAEFLEIEAPKTPQGEWDYSLLPMFIESVLNCEGDEYDEDDEYGEEEDDEEGGETPARRMSKKLQELGVKEKDLENFFDEDKCDANFPSSDEGMEYVDDLHRFIEERKLGLDEKVDVAVENAMHGRFERYFLGEDETNQFARYNRNAVREMNELGIDPAKWLRSTKEDKFVLNRREINELLNPQEIIERTRKLVTTALGSRKEGIQGYLIPGVIKRVWGTVQHALGKPPSEISVIAEAKLFLKNLQANWKQVNTNIPEAMATACLVGGEISLLLKHLDMSFSNREGGLVTMRLWKRNVGTDIFIGNYSHCCVGVGECNQTSIYDWLSLAPTNVITISIQNERTHEKPRYVGAIFAAAFREGEIARLLVDGIELDNMIACISNLELRMLRFMREFSQEVGFRDTPYYARRYVRVDTTGFSEKTVNIDMIGGFPSFEDELYFETYEGWTNSFSSPVKVLVEPVPEKKKNE